MILINPTTLVPTLADSITCQMRKLWVELTEEQALDIARNLAMAVMGLEVDETHVIDTRTLLSPRDRHHDRCMAPGDDEHLTCPVVGGRE